MSNLGLLDEWQTGPVDPNQMPQNAASDLGLQCLHRLIVLGFNDTSTLVGHFVSSPREREKRDSRGDEREG